MAKFRDELRSGEEIRLRKGLQQIVDGDYPATAGDAETWAGEILNDSFCVDWELEERP